MPAIPREHLREHLVASRIAGSVRTPVGDVLRKAERVARAARDGEHVLFATGHPTGPLGMYQMVSAAMRDGGAKVSRPGDGIAFMLGGQRRMIRYVLQVATLASASKLYHTHDALPMELVLDQAGEVDLVVGDHGFAGAAAERGIDVVSVADINDPALPMAKAEGRAEVVVGMDDNVLPAHYEPLAEHLTA